ncbi:MAG: FixH family protein [Rubripirellula sp.]
MNSQTEAANRRAAWRWGGLVVGLLSLQVAGGIFAIMLATGDESVAVVPDYHQKALQWDQEIAIQEASRQLGWTCEMDATITGDENPGVRIALTDRQGVPVTIEQGEIEIYRHVRASDVRSVALPKGTIGVVELNDCFPSPGLWQVSLDVTDRHGNRFTVSRELDVQP